MLYSLIVNKIWGFGSTIMIQDQDANGNVKSWYLKHGQTTKYQKKNLWNIGW